MQPTVYLAGPITGLNFNGCTEWRREVQAQLASAGIRAFSPMRGKDYLARLEQISGHGREYAHLGVLSTPRAVMTRDRFDATRCDALLVNLLGAERVSIGSCMEIAWADLARIPIVCAMEPEGNPHDHMMIGEAVGFRVPTLDEAMHVLRVMLA
jgi:nucleoside 2-deoxyribosyltransferase